LQVEIKRNSRIGGNNEEILYIYILYILYIVLYKIKSLLKLGGRICDSVADCTAILIAPTAIKPWTKCRECGTLGASPPLAKYREWVVFYGRGVSPALAVAL